MLEHNDEFQCGYLSDTNHDFVLFFKKHIAYNLT